MTCFGSGTPRVSLLWVKEASGDVREVERTILKENKMI